MYLHFFNGLKEWYHKKWRTTILFSKKGTLTTCIFLKKYVDNLFLLLYNWHIEKGDDKEK